MSESSASVTYYLGNCIFSRHLIRTEYTSISFLCSQMQRTWLTVRLKASSPCTSAGEPSNRPKSTMSSVTSSQPPSFHSPPSAPCVTSLYGKWKRICASSPFNPRNQSWCQCQSWHLRTWFSVGCGRSGLMVGLDVFKDLFQPKRFHGSLMNICALPVRPLASYV